MVIFELVKNTGDIIYYEYYPEGDKTKKPGVIAVDTVRGRIEVTVLAEEDLMGTTSVAELNSMRDSINAMRMEEGQPELTEEEWPSAVEPIKWYRYADHAMRKITKTYNDGTILEKGSVVWY